MCGWCSLFVSLSLNMFVEGGWVGRPLGKLMCIQLCVRMCVCVLLLWHHCCRHCSHLTVTPLWLKAWQPPTLSPSTPPLCWPLLPGFIYSLTLHSPAFCLLLFLIYLSFCPLSFSFYFTHILFAFFHVSSPSFVVWVFPVFRHALCAHSAPCLCLYGNPEWTRVARRSVRHWYRLWIICSFSLTESCVHM